ncbi:MAG: DUF805 domain-containing protein [Muribaculaceae bacterium]|nr:DUF805 domain-containing protein [Muribaculaceae bacterium]
MSKYFIANGEQSKGPFALNELLNNGLTPDAQIVAEGQNNWIKAADVPEVAALFTSNQTSQAPMPPQPPQQHQVSDPPQAPQPAAGAAVVVEAKPVYEASPITEFFEAIRTCFANYANFKGRARRSEFWWFVLFVITLSSLTVGLGFLVVAVPLAAVSVRRLHDITQNLTVKKNLVLNKGININLSQFFNYSGWSVAFHFLFFVVVLVLFYLFYVFYDHSFTEQKVFTTLAYLLFFATLIMVALYCIDSDKKDNVHGYSPKYFLATDEMADIAGRPMMGFVTSIVTCYKKYFNYRDRARRSELWWFVLLSVIVSFILFSIRPYYIYIAGLPFHFKTIYFTINQVLFLFIVLLPLLAAVCRRLHDTNHSGTWTGVFIMFLLLARFVNLMYTNVLEMKFSTWSNAISYIYKLKGRIVIMELYGWGFLITAIAFFVAITVMCCLDGDKVPNEYEESPKYGPEEEELE